MVTSSDLLQTTYPVVEPDATISKAYPLFGQHDTIMIVDGHAKFHGVLRKRDALRPKLPEDAKISNLSHSVSKISPDTPIEELAWLLLESDVYQLPVFVKNKLQGVVTTDAVLTSALAGSFGDTPIKSFMSHPVKTAPPDETVGKALRIFKDHDISRLPIVDHGKLVGIVTMDDLITRLFHPDHKAKGLQNHGELIGEKEKKLQLPLAGFMNRELVLMSPETPTRDVFAEIERWSYRGMLLGEQGQLQGIVTKKDLLRPLARAEIQEPLVIQFAGDWRDITEFTQDEAREELQKVFHKYLTFLRNANVVVTFEQREKKLRGYHLISCEIRVSAAAGRFVATDEGWGYFSAMRKTSSAIERQIHHKKRRRKS